MKSIVQCATGVMIGDPDSLRLQFFVDRNWTPSEIAELAAVERFVHVGPMTT